MSGDRKSEQSAERRVERGRAFSVIVVLSQERAFRRMRLRISLLAQISLEVRLRLADVMKQAGGQPHIAGLELLRQSSRVATNPCQMSFEQLPLVFWPLGGMCIKRHTHF